MNSASAFAIRFLREENGQDLVEYGLLAVIFAVAAALIFPSLIPAMGNSYSNHAYEINNVWIPGDPVAP
jgi:Flp pilus assembly protein, pilin Flp